MSQCAQQPHQRRTVRAQQVVLVVVVERGHREKKNRESDKSDKNSTKSQNDVGVGNSFIDNTRL